MPQHVFVSYSSVDGREFALRVADELSAGPPAIPVWVDKRKLRPGEDWDEQIVEAIKTCKSMLFVMTQDSVQPQSVCKDEWVRALKYKKPIVPLLASRDADLPFRLSSREYVDFTGSFDAALARLRTHLAWLDSTEGQLQQLKYRLVDAQRELPRADPEKQARIKEDIAELERQVAQQQKVVDDPAGAEQRVKQSIDRGLEVVREPAQPVSRIKQPKFINPPPAIAPTWFQDRHVESGLIGDFLKDAALRLMTVVGRGGIGKSAMVCRLLKSLEGGQLPDDAGPLAVEGIVYLSNARSFHRVTVPELYAGLRQLLREDVAARLDTVYKNPQASTSETMEALLAEFASGRTVVLLDNFEDALEGESGRIKDRELHDALRALLELPLHGLKVIITTRVAPPELADVEPGRQRRLDLDKGLEHPFAENVLRAMDADGRLGLRDAPEKLLAEARERTRGNPRALEHLYGILSADRDTTLKEILEDTKRLLPEKVLQVLVGEAFSRLEPAAQRVMQALATYRYPVPAAAVDYLLQPFVPGVDSAPVLKRLVNMQFARRETGRYYLHQVDRDYSLNRIPAGDPGDRELETPPLTRFGLTHRAADWFKQTRKPREDWKTLEDVAPQLAEFDLRQSGEDYDQAAAVLLEIDFDYLMLWGQFRLVTELHERLQGRIIDADLAEGSVGNLGTAYMRIGRYQEALSCYERALNLARNQTNRWDVAGMLGNIGAVYAELGQSTLAIKCYEQALAIKRDMKDRNGEAFNLGNLANQYSARGQMAEAIEYSQMALGIRRELKDPKGQALILNNLGCMYSNLGDNIKALDYLEEAQRIAQEIEYPLVETNSINNIAEIYVDEGELSKGVQQFRLGLELADNMANTQTQNEARTGLALAYLYQNELTAAREAAEAALRFDYPLYNHHASMVFAVIALRQGDLASARQASAAAVDKADALLTQNPQLFGALNVKGLALCGLALCEDVKHLQAAGEAFEAARAISSAPGLVRRVLRLFDAVAQADTAGMLRDIRAAVAGDQGVAVRAPLGAV